MDYIENQLFDEIEVGDTACASHVLTRQDIQLFAVMTGDINPIHMDADYTNSAAFHDIMARSLWSDSLIATVLGTQLPGPGTIFQEQHLKSLRPVALGDTITATLRVLEKHSDTNTVILDCQCTNQQGKEIITGRVTVIAPTEKIHRPLSQLTQIQTAEKRRDELGNGINNVDKRGGYEEKLIAQKQDYAPLKTAIVHPVDANSLIGAIKSAKEGLIIPILVGPEAKIRKVAEEEDLDISAFELIATEHSHAAAARAVELVHEGRAEALMKGKIHTDEFMAPIIAKVGGLQTGRRMSHVLVVDIPSYHKPLFITDAALNILPNLSQKKDMVQNAIDLFLAVRPGIPKVAIVSAVETIEEAIPSTLDAAALCKMAERGQITGGILDGPLAFDLAISREAAKVKNVVSQVAGDADIIVAPNLESANMLTKQLSYLFNIDAPGIVLGARVPIILTSRSASSEGLTRQASCALALLYARHQGAMIV
jgi:phosphate acetyltransferase